MTDLTMWEIEYDNDTGTNDDGYRRWWTVTNGIRYFGCNGKDDAIWLCDLLNHRELKND